MRKNWTQETVRLLVARFYKTPRINSISPAKSWDIYNQSTKIPLYPSSREIIEILEVNEWKDVQKIAKEVTTEWQTKLGKEDVRKEINQHLGRLEYIQFLEPYREYLNSIPEYNAFRKEQKDKLALPSLNSIIKMFGSWSEFKSEFGYGILPTGRKAQYTREKLLLLLVNYTKIFPYSEWNKHAKKYNLPPKVTIMKYLTEEDIEPFLKNSRHRSAEELIEIAWGYRKEFTGLSVRKWITFSKENRLPSKQTFINKWGHEQYMKVLTYLESPQATYEGLNELF